MTQGEWMGIGTLTTLVAMVSIFVWAYSSKRRADFDEAARLPFADERDATNGDSGT